MKQVVLMLGLLALTAFTPAGTNHKVEPFTFDNAAFKESFNQLMVEAKTKFKEIQKGEGTLLSDGSGTSYEVTYTLSQAREVSMLVDRENYHRYIAKYPEMASLEEAAELLNKILEVVIVNVPEGFKYKQGYHDTYENNIKVDVMLDTESHSELGRVPSVSLGIVKDNFAWYVECTVSAPYW